MREKRQPSRKLAKQHANRIANATPCPTPFKASFAKKKWARQVARKRDMRIYKCPGCKEYHLTSNLDGDRS